ncbi:MAG TPA: hypothetical protein VGQ76_11120 [Thermoanaerobaculia bacterium]|jgi:hypothetical protein|nr:hypothetical protein [Thermoanaerobaculia bacterium]
MNECPREQETLDHVRAGRWPNGCDEEMRAHVATCESCDGSVKVATLMAADYRAAMSTARVPSSGLVWWRVQRRAREEAEHNAARVVTLVQGVSVAVGVAVTVGITGADRVSETLRVAFDFTTLSYLGVPLLFAVTAWLAIAPVALYLAVSRD